MIVLRETGERVAVDASPEVVSWPGLSRDDLVSPALCSRVHGWGGKELYTEGPRRWEEEQWMESFKCGLTCG